MSGLAGSGPFYFALRSVDAAANRAALSNIVPLGTCNWSPEGLMLELQAAYEGMNLERIEALFASEPQAEYMFLLAERGPDGELQWSRAEDVRIHSRMFRPRDIPADDRPLPATSWIQGIDLELRASAPFTERTIPGLDPVRWKALRGTYLVQAEFFLPHPYGYSFDTVQVFIVLEDLGKQLGEPGKFLLYRWEDRIYTGTKTASPVPFTRFKAVYK